jgi:hypothetical protein
VPMLYDRIIGTGNLSEKRPKPEPNFALPATVNWMKALKVIVEDQKIDFNSATEFYKKVNKRKMQEYAENTVLEQLFLALHHLSALEKMSDASPVADYARLAIVGWYYGLSNAASAMIAAQVSQFHDEHAATANSWDSAIAANKLAIEPFNWRVTSLIKKTYKQEIEVYRAGSSANLKGPINSVDEARGALASYLSGSAEWHGWKASEDAKRSKEFRDLGVNNFRTKDARNLRDQFKSKRKMGFLHQAIRYRGKANYRDALFLAYGKSADTMMEGFINDQVIVLRAFVAMAGAFCAKKLGSDLWEQFVSDVEANKAFSLSAMSVWK